MSSDRVCYTSSMMSCHSLCHTSVCAVLSDDHMSHRRHLTMSAFKRAIMEFKKPDVVRMCMLLKGDDSTIKHNVVSSRVRSKGDDNMPRPTSFDRVSCPREMMICHTRRCLTLCMVSKSDDGVLSPTSFNRVCWPWFMTACHA